MSLTCPQSPALKAWPHHSQRQLGWCSVDRMPRTKPLYSDFYYRPLVEDVEELLARFQHTDTVRYEVFSAIWREMKLSDISFGIGRAGDMKRFARTTLATAMKYFLPPYSFQIRVGGLYLLYGFYHTQLAHPKVQIRIPLRDWPSVQNFLRDSLESSHLDVLYIYQKLSADKAIHYTAMPHYLAFQRQRQQVKEPPMCAEFLGRTTAVQDLVSSDFLQELSNIQSQYVKMKEVAKVGSEVSIVHQNLDTCMNETLLEFLTWQQKNFPQPGNEREQENSGSDEEKLNRVESSSRARLLSSIKQKSYRSVQVATKSRRHRQSQLDDSASSGVEQSQEAEPRRRRPLSLRARTCQSFGVKDVKRECQAWLLSVPEKWERLPGNKRTRIRPSSPPQEQSPAFSPGKLLVP